MKPQFRTMWKALSLILVFVTGSACQKAGNLQATIEKPSEPPATPGPLAKLITPAPKALAAKATPIPAQTTEDFLAPEGVFFLTTAVSVETADGVSGLRPGTRAVKQTDGRYLADGHLVTLRPEQLTNDTRFAARAAHADQSAQAVIQRRLVDPTPRPEAKTSSTSRRSARDQPAASETETEDTERKYVPGVTTQPSGLQTSTALGTGHTRTANGYLWQKTPDGKFWTAVKRLDGKPLDTMPSDVPVR